MVYIHYRSSRTENNTKSFRTYLDSFLNKPGPKTDPDFVPGEDTITALETSKVLSVAQKG